MDNINDTQDNVTKNKIKNRNNIFIIIIISVLTIVIAIKLYMTDFTLILSEYSENVSSFLAIIISLFAIVISVLFYVKNNELTNQFNQNNVEFINKILVSLSAMDEKFGQQLDNIKDNYQAMSSGLNSLGKNANEDKAIYDKQKEEYESTIDDLIKKSKMEAQEKADLRVKLRDMQSQLDSASKRMQNSREEITMNNKDISEFAKFITRNMSLLDLERIAKRSFNDELIYQYKQNMSKVPARVKKSLYLYGIIDDKEYLTEKGYDLITIF